MNHNRVRLRFIDPNTESAQSIHSSQTIVAHEKSVQPTNPIGESGNNGGTMRNALVARHSDFRVDVRCAFNPKFHVPFESPATQTWEEESCRHPRRLSSVSKSHSTRTFSVSPSGHPEREPRDPVAKPYGTRKILLV